MRNIFVVALCLCFSVGASLPAEAAFGDFLKKAGEKIDKEVDKATDPYKANSATKYNSDKTMVLQAQRQLKRIGYAVSVDGAYGPGTKAAIEKFQQSKGMKVNGNVTPKLIKKLSKAPTPAKVAAAPKVATKSSSTAAGSSKSSGTAPLKKSGAASTKLGASKEKTTSVSHWTLFEMYMASQGDILNVPAVAHRYYHRFELPPGTGPNYADRSAACKAYFQRWENADEFTRLDLISSERTVFTAALQQAKSGAKTHKITITGKGTLGNYDMKSQKFPLTLQLDLIPIVAENMGNFCNPSYYTTARQLEGQHLVPRFSFDRVDLPTTSEIPMSKDKAKAYLNAHKVDGQGNPAPSGAPNRSVKLLAEAEIGPVRIEGGKLKPIPVRILSAAIIDPLNGNTLRTLDTGSASSTVETTSKSGGSVPANNFNLGMLALKDHPELLSDEAALQVVENQIIQEQNQWNQIDRYLENCRKYANSCPSLNKNKPVFAYEWATLAKTRPDFANGIILDIFRNPETSWSFVKRDKNWDDRFEAIVTVLLFSRETVQGRDPKFAARELLPVWKRHLAEVVKRLPRQLHISTDIVRASYNFDLQAVDLIPAYKNIAKHHLDRSPLKDLPDLFLPNLNPVFAAPTAKDMPNGIVTVLPASAANSLLYKWEEPASSQNYGATSISVGRINENASASSWRSSVGRLFWSQKLRSDWLALDRRLALASLSMNASEGEQFVQSLQTSPLRAKVTFNTARTDLGKRVSRGNMAGDKFPVVFGNVDRLELIKDGKTTLVSINAKDLPSAQSVVAAAQKADEDAALSAQSAQQKAAADKQQKADQLLAECDSRSPELAILQCRHETCRTNYNMFDREVCRAHSEKYSAMANADRQCRGRFQRLTNTLSTPAPGSPPFEAAISVCLKDPRRTKYGPDIIGLRLGMQVGEARNVASGRFKNGWQDSQSKRPFPFDHSSLLWGRKVANEGVALFSIQGQDGDRLAGVGRRLYFEGNGPEKNGIVKGLRDKYGKEASSNGNTLVWAFPPKTSKLKDTGKCAPLAKMVKVRGGWQRDWKPPFDRDAQRAEYQKKSSAAQAKYNACSRRIQKIYTEKFEDASESKIEKLSYEMQDELSVCGEEYNAATSKLSADQSDNREIRSPLMIEGGNPKGFYSYRSCGPVLVTKFTPGEGGRLKGAAFVLFDPEWVGRQPGFMFKSSKEPAKKTGGAGGSAIDF